MNILQVVNYYPPASSFGGPPRVMFDFGQELVRKGHHVRVYTTDLLNIENWKERITERDHELNGIVVHRLRVPPYLGYMPTKFPKLMVRGLNRQYAEDREKIDIVHISEVTNPLAVKVSELARTTGKPYVISPFGNLCRPSDRVVRLLRHCFDTVWGYRALQQASGIFVQTPHEEELCRHYAPKGNIIHVRLPIDFGVFDNLPARGAFRRAHGIGMDEKVVLFLGRLHKNKGAQLLIKAFSLSLANIPPSRLILAGADEGYRKTLEDLSRELLGNGKTIFTGPIFNEAKLEAYVDADVFVLTPDVYEETSLAALEAAACGIPAVITERNAVPGLEEFGAGFQISHDAGVLRDVLVRLLNDRDLRRHMGANARRLVKQDYSLDVVVGRVERILSDLTRDSVGYVPVEGRA